MANYLFLKQSTEPVKVGDLILHLKGAFAGHFHVVNDIHNNYMGIYSNNEDFVILTPLLITDAPDLPYKKYLFGDFEEGSGTLDEDIKTHFKKYVKQGIPFHSNEQVYNWLKSKGIKPEAEMLIEFDGEVEFKYMIASDDSVGNPTRWAEYTEPSYNRCIGPHKKKVAIIKDTEVKQESEEQLWREAEMLLPRNYGDMFENQNPNSYKEVQLHFKIERRKHD